MTNTQRLRAFRTLVNGWAAGRLTEADINNFVRAQWITKEEGERIKNIRRGDTQMAKQIIDQYEIAMES